MPSLTSVNIACGGHAGDEHTMKATIEQALRWKLALGAHPGYPDRANFGRLELNLSPKPSPIPSSNKFAALADVAARYGARLVHVKPHGALYNQAARDRAIAEAIAQGVARWRRDVVLVGLAGSPMLEVFRDAGFRGRRRSLRRPPLRAGRHTALAQIRRRAHPRSSRSRTPSFAHRGARHGDCVRWNRSPRQRANSSASTATLPALQKLPQPLPARYAGPGLVSALSRVTKEAVLRLSHPP